MLVYKGWKISADVQLYDWYDVDEEGVPTASQGELIDSEAMTIDQWNVYHQETGNEYWLDGKLSIEEVREFIDKREGK